MPINDGPSIVLGEISFELYESLWTKHQRLVGVRGGIKKKILGFYDYSPKGGRGGLGKSEISLSEKN